MRAGVETSAGEAEQRILAVVGLLGAGEVVSYGDIADDAGIPGRARLVGRVLARCTDDVPWWRVVTAAGRLVPGLEATQSGLLTGEGVVVHAGRVRAAPAGRFRRSQ